MSDKFDRMLARATKFYRNEYGDTMVEMPSEEYHKSIETPSAQRICDAIEMEVGGHVNYNEPTKEFVDRDNGFYLTETYGDGRWTVNFYMSPTLMGMIARFYEGELEYEYS